MFPELAVLYAYSYLAGAIPTPYLIARFVKGIDLRQYGSGNVGGSNVARQLGKKWFVPLAVAEFFLKGLSPALLGVVLLGHIPDSLSDQMLFLLAPLLAMVGNNWSVFLRFKGGRGLMVVCGMVLALVPLMFVVGILVYLAGWRLTRSSAIWALIAVILLPFLALLPGGIPVLDWSQIVDTLRQGVPPELRESQALATSCFCSAILALVVLKRLMANSMAFPEELSGKRVLLNRFLLDRDVDDRAEWVSRTPS